MRTRKFKSSCFAITLVGLTSLWIPQLAVAGDDMVALHWTTQSETENLGFHIYRGSYAVRKLKSITWDGSFSKRIKVTLFRGPKNPEAAAEAKSGRFSQTPREKCYLIPEPSR